MRSKHFWYVFLAAALVVIPKATADNVNYEAQLDGDQQNPPVDTPATGSAIITLDKDTNELCIDLTFSGLKGPQSAAHVHGPAPRGQNAGVLFAIPMGDFFECFNLADEHEQFVKDGLTYINIHSDPHPGGEIRGQIEKVPPGPPPPVPTTSEWSLIALALALLAGGGVVLARREGSTRAA